MGSSVRDAPLEIEWEESINTLYQAAVGKKHAWSQFRFSELRVSRSPRGTWTCSFRGYIHARWIKGVGMSAEESLANLLIRIVRIRVP